MCFFVTQIYLNLIMFFFLNTQQSGGCLNFINCRHQVSCYSRYRLELIFAQGNCPCHLNQKMLSIINKPLQREVLQLEKFPQRRLHLNLFYIQRFEGPRSFKKFPERGQYLMNSHRASSMIDRLVSTGFFSSTHFEPKEVDITRFFAGSTSKVYKLRDKWSQQRLTRFIGFDATIDNFNMESFHKIRPLFGLCAFAMLMMLLFETMWKQLARFPVGFLSRILSRIALQLSRRRLSLTGASRAGRAPKWTIRLIEIDRWTRGNLLSSFETRHEQNLDQGSWALLLSSRAVPRFSMGACFLVQGEARFALKSPTRFFHSIHLLIAVRFSENGGWV